jgi:hypothetical protein
VGKFSEEPGLWDGVGKIDYLTFTEISFPTGVVGSLISFQHYLYKEPKTHQMEKAEILQIIT